MRAMRTMGLAACTLAACAPAPKELYVDKAWVRLGAVPGRPAAAYFTVHGGPRPATLINVTTDVAIQTEMHRSMATGGMAAMKPVRDVAIPAEADLAFAPGGRHVMLFDVNPGIKPGARITFTFTFADGTRILQSAAVLAAGGDAPG